MTFLINQASFDAPSPIFARFSDIADLFLKIVTPPLFLDFLGVNFGLNC